MRTFYLQNAMGQMWNLNDTDSFFHSVKGLGQGYSTAYTQVGNRYLQKKNSLSQKKITGKVRFKGYEEFGDFSRFIQHKPLTLAYGIRHLRKVYPPFYPENWVYLLDVAVTLLEKSELETGGLQCKLIFESLGTYYRIFDAAGTGSVVIDSDTVLASGIRIEIAGSCVNPSYQQFIGDSLVCSGRFLCEISAGSRLVIDTTTLPYEVFCQAPDGSRDDLYGSSDFSTKRFVTLGYGRNEIRFSHDGVNSLEVVVEAKLEYESV